MTIGAIVAIALVVVAAVGRRYGDPVPQKIRKR